MAYRIEISPAARRTLRKLSREEYKRIRMQIWKLADDPRPPGVKKLEDKDNFYRIREGEYRIIYQIKDEVMVVLILKIGHRKEIYQRLK